MTKRTMTPEELEWETNREVRHQWTLQRLNNLWREVEQEGAQAERSSVRRRFFPWRIRIERLG